VILTNIVSPSPPPSGSPARGRNRETLAFEAAPDQFSVASRHAKETLFAAPQTHEELRQVLSSKLARDPVFMPSKMATRDAGLPNFEELPSLISFSEPIELF
jgi:hypothetical protein